MDIIDSLVSNKVSGVYRALVISDKDPTHTGRIQIRVPSLHGIPFKSDSYTPDKDLPWAQPASMQGLGVNEGQIVIPKPGSIVFVVFEADNILNPLYLGTAFLKSNAYAIGSKEAKSNAIPPDLYGPDGTVARDIIFRTATGKTIYVDRATGDIHADIEGGGTDIEIVDLTEVPPPEDL